MANVPSNIETTRSRGRTFGNVHTLKGQEYPAYDIQEDLVGDGWKVIRYIRAKNIMGRDSTDSEIVMKGVPKGLAQRYVYHRLDPKNNPRPRLKGLEEERWAMKKRRGADINTNMRELLEKHGNPKRGIDLSDLEHRGVLLFGGQKAGIVTDGFLLVRDKKVADDVLGGYIDKLKRKEAAFNQRINPKMTRAEAEAEAEKSIEARRGGTFPNWKPLVPENLTEEWRPIGTTVLASGDQVVWLGNGEGKYIAINADKLAFIYDKVSGIDAIRSAEVKAPTAWRKDLAADAHDGPLVFEKKGRVMAIVMPMYVAEIPSKIREASPKARIARPPVVEKAKAVKGKAEAKAITYKAEKTDAGDILVIYRGNEPIGNLRQIGKGKSPDVELRSSYIEKPMRFPMVSLGDISQRDVEKVVEKYITKPKTKVERRVKVAREGKQYSMAEIRKRQLTRSVLSQRMDSARSHQVTISPSSPKVESWMKNAGRADIEGIDTPAINRRGVKISQRTPRISPRVGRLK